MFTDTDPAPVPDNALVKLNQVSPESSFVTVHAQPAFVTTDTDVEPPPVVASAVDKARIEFSRRRLVDFYELSLLAYAGDREAWAIRTRAFMRDAEPNAYYDWVFGR